MNRRRWTSVVMSTLLGTLLCASQVAAQGREASLVDSSSAVLNEFMSIPAEGIPRSMIASAEGLVIIPGMFKVGFVAGVRHGKGIVVIKDQNGAWRPPMFVSMTGGSVGWQVGVQATDVILVFKTRKSVNGLLNGKFTIGADAAAAAGPVGRQAAAATDAQLRAEILSYSRSRGLFAGVSLDGSALQVDGVASQDYYRQAGMSPDGTPLMAGAQLPPSAGRLLAQLATYSGAARAGDCLRWRQGNANVALVVCPAVSRGGQPVATGAEQPAIPDAGAMAGGAAVVRHATADGGAGRGDSTEPGRCCEAIGWSVGRQLAQLSCAAHRYLQRRQACRSPQTLNQTLQRFEAVARRPAVSSLEPAQRVPAGGFPVANLHATGECASQSAWDAASAPCRQQPVRRRISLNSGCNSRCSASPAGRTRHRQCATSARARLGTSCIPR